MCSPDDDDDNKSRVERIFGDMTKTQLLGESLVLSFFAKCTTRLYRVLHALTRILQHFPIIQGRRRARSNGGIVHFIAQLDVQGLSGLHVQGRSHEGCRIGRRIRASPIRVIHQGKGSNRRDEFIIHVASIARIVAGDKIRRMRRRGCSRNGR